MNAPTADGPGYGRVDRDYARRLLTGGDDGPIWMVNLISYRDEAAYADGERGVSGREADDRYAPLGILADIGAEVAFVAEVEDQLLGASPRWDRVVVVRYPTRRAFMEMQQRPDFQERHVHKEAGLAATVVTGCVPFALPGGEAGRPDWSGVEHPPTAEDGPVVVCHVLSLHQGAEQTDMAAYTAKAMPVAVRHGARPIGWFRVEGTIVGDGRTWDQVRFIAFPSRRAFMAVVADRLRLDAQAAHREPALADTYTLVLRASVDGLAASGAITEGG